MSKTVTIYNAAGEQWGAVAVTELATGFQFTEGAFFHPDGYFLFSDTPANSIIRWTPDKGTDIFLEEAGCHADDRDDLSDQVGPNGLAMDREGNLLICQHGDHAVARLDDQNQLLVLTGQYNKRPYNSPNDIAVRSDGLIYFTDPPYGLKDQVLHADKYQPIAGLYCLQKDQIICTDTGLQYPNGLCFSPGEEWLYVSTNHNDEAALLRFDVQPDGSLNNKTILAKENGDGITADVSGNIWMATDNGILIVSPEGKRLALIAVPETPSNICRGRHEQEYFVTARSGIYLLSW